MTTPANPTDSKRVPRNSATPEVVQEPAVAPQLSPEGAPATVAFEEKTSPKGPR
jgi:hypothetical protein